ncbi:MAG TPA: hypothetical protein VMG59_02660 [Phycisphaerae bacterium]|nr:hypothetical protein [Phycisphaerae bacterium]
MDGSSVMLKILTCLITFLLIGATLFGLRRQEWEFTRETTQIFQNVRLCQQTLWDQQTKIAQDTNPIILGQKIQNIQGTGSDATMPIVGLPQQVTNANGQVVPSVVMQTPVDTEPP